MILYNISAERSIKSVVWMSVFAIILTAFILFLYLTSTNDYSVINFAQWFIEGFKSMEREFDGGDKWVVWLIFLGLPLGVYGGLIGCIMSRSLAIQKFNNAINVKYVEFLSGIINFRFTQPKYDITCSCKDIDKVEMDIETKIVHTRNGSYVAFNQLIVNFNIFKKTLKVFLAPNSPIKTIYQVIDLTREVKEFSFHFSGAGEIPDIKEKTQTYLDSGYKDMISNSSTKNLMFISALFFGIGVFFVILLQNEIRDAMSKHSGEIIVFAPLLIFPMISFIIDIVLVIDRIRDTQNRGFHG